jgi:hypothetical protein
MGPNLSMIGMSKVKINLYFYSNSVFMTKKQSSVRRQAPKKLNEFSTTNCHEQDAS